MTKSKFQLVGSLLRPADFRKYKDEIEHRDDIQYPFYDALPGYQETETADIKQIVADQKDNGIEILTDGEFGRSMWHLDFVWGLKGIERYIAEHGYTFKDHDGGQYETRKDIGIRITEPLSGKNHHYLDIYKLVKAEAVLGLLSSKTTKLDDEERVLDLLEKASQILPKERHFLSYQCGFASCDSGNELATPQQWAKIKQGQDIAKKFFG